MWFTRDDAVEPLARGTFATSIGADAEFATPLSATRSPIWLNRAELWPASPVLVQVAGVVVPPFAVELRCWPHHPWPEPVPIEGSVTMVCGGDVGVDAVAG